MRRLRVVPPRQLELLSAPDGPGPAVVWATLPEHNRATVLAIFARLIAAGVVDEDEDEEEVS